MNSRLLQRIRARVPLLTTTFLAIVFSLVLIYFTTAAIGNSQEIAKQRRENLAVAHVIATQIEQGTTNRTMSALTHLLTDEHMRAIVRTHGTVTAFGSHLEGGETKVTVSVPGDTTGTVTIIGRLDSAPNPPLVIVLLTTGALVIVLGVAVGTNEYLRRKTRRQVALAVETADRIRAGDLTARIGDHVSEPLRSLGLAFDAMAARLQDADSTQREFLADLAHEIATPIHAISGFALAILDGTIDSASARPAIEGQVERLTQMLDELSELRQLDDDREPQGRPTDLRDLLSQLVTQVTPLAQHLQMTQHFDSVRITTDPEMVRTVVLNLLTNACRYTPAGGRVDVSLHERAGVVTISVRDTGPGIALEHHSRIFDRFYRVENSRDREQGGSGLGLAIARRAAERLHGQLTVHSTPGEGSEFRFILNDRARLDNRDGATPRGSDVVLS